MTTTGLEILTAEERARLNTRIASPEFVAEAAATALAMAPHDALPITLALCAIDNDGLRWLAEDGHMAQVLADAGIAPRA
jgi:hypothetical protein